MGLLWAYILAVKTQKEKRRKRQLNQNGDSYSMTHIDRNKLIGEQILRKHIRKKLIERKNRLTEQEDKFRSLVKKLLSEVETDETSTRSTGINVLADLLKRIVPILEDSYMMLTTSAEQRNSFRNHIIAAAKNSLVPVDAGKNAANENVVYDLTQLLEKVQVTLDDDAEGDGTEQIAGDFIDIEPAEEDVLDDFGISGEDATGRNFAQKTFERIETQIVDHYEMLADPEDKDVFREYLLTNLMLYFDKFEDSLAVDPGEETTPEYEEEKAESDAETDPVDDAADDAAEDLGDDEEEGEEPPPA
jgi:hypothetical protein